jgi:hypothetical protein
MDFSKAIIRAEEEKEIVTNYLTELANKIQLLKNSHTQVNQQIRQSNNEYEKTFLRYRLKRITRSITSYLIQQAHSMNELEEIKEISIMWLNKLNME